MSVEEKNTKYPIGIQTFSEIIEDGYLYVDKTAYVYKLANGMPKYLFLSRPRRFGKSLLLSTLKCYFEGRRELFKGLAIESLEHDWIANPVIHLSLAGFKGNEPEKLRQYLNNEFRRFERQFGDFGRCENLGSSLKNLIEYLYESTGRKVVVLIDEYDNPLLCVVHDKAKRPALQAVVTELYATLKDSDQWLRFVFITGVTKFSQLSIFSELNNITNISMRDEFSAVCGITKEELDTQMAQGLRSLAEAMDTDVEDMRLQITDRYDGYKFSAKGQDIYNPYSLLKCFEEKDIRDYWFETGTPTYLIEVLNQYKVVPSNIGKVQATASDFDAPTEDMKSWIPLFYQSGYLTIKDYNPIVKLYTLDIPNSEVRTGLMKSLLTDYVKNPLMASGTVADMMLCFYNEDIAGALSKMAKFFETVPYCNNIDYEGHWQQMLYVIFSLFGAYADVEVHAPKGRIDMVMIFMKKLYLFEIKLNGTAQEAIDQITTKGYSKRFQLLNLPIVKIGISFDTTNRTITDKIILE
ncbi:MAG: ATP-binding protein [Bacteroidales bacterium]|nr:ATP-binding protein [Bacteroidales bacterium]